MKLYDVPGQTWVRITGDIGIPVAAPELKVGDELFFHHIDGMYSYCTRDIDSHNEICHLVAWAEVEIIEDENKYPF